MITRHLLSFLISTICIIGIIPGSIEAAELISRSVTQNGREFHITEGSTTPTPIKVKLLKPTEGEWSIRILTRHGKYQAIDCIESFTGYCIIEPKNYSWNEAFREFDQTTGRDYFNFILSFRDIEGQEDNIGFKWGLLPSKPVLSDFDFNYQYDWADDMIYPNGYFSFAVESKDSDIYWLNLTDCFLFDNPGYFTFSYTFDSTSHDRIGYEAEWGEFLDVAAQNKFGFVHSDTICTTDFITDKDILQRIQSIRDGNSVCTITDNSKFVWDNGKLLFSNRMDVNIYNVAGNQIRTEKNTDNIVMTDIQPGIYLVIFSDGLNIYKSKIHKR